MAQRDKMETECVCVCVSEREREFVDQPVFVVILGPELAKMLKRGSNNCEAFRPHEFGEEGRDASEAIAINTVRGTSCFVFLVRRERE